MKDFPNLGYDPAPGNPERVRQLRQILTDFASEFDIIRRRLDDRGKILSATQSRALAENLGQLNSLKPVFDAICESVGMAEPALARWFDDLSRLQNVAIGAEHMAEYHAQDASTIAERCHGEHREVSDWIARELERSINLLVSAQIIIRSAQVKEIDESAINQAIQRDR